MTTPVATADCDGNVTFNTIGTPTWGNGPTTAATYTLNGAPITLPHTYKPGESVTSAVFVGHYVGTLNGEPASGQVEYPVSWTYPADCPVVTTTPTTSTHRTAPPPSTAPPTTNYCYSHTTNPGTLCKPSTTQHHDLPPTGSNAGPAIGGSLALLVVGAIAVLGTRRRANA